MKNYTYQAIYDRMIEYMQKQPKAPHPYDHVLNIVAKHVTPQQYNAIACEVYPDPWLDEPLTEEEQRLANTADESEPWGPSEDAELDSPNFVPKELVEFAARGFERRTIMVDGYAPNGQKPNNRAVIIDRELTREQVLKEASDFAREHGYTSFYALWKDIEAGLHKGTLLEMRAKSHIHLLGGDE